MGPLITLFVFSWFSAQAVQPAPTVLTNTTVGDARGVALPLHLPLRNGQAQQRTLNDWANRNRPIVLTFNYMSCPMLCGLQHNDLATAIQTIGLKPGTDFFLVSVSVNPAETSDMAKRATTTLTDGVGGPWTMLTAAQPTIDALTQAAQFNYAFDPETGQYAHPAVTYILTPQGTISQVLRGINSDPQDLRLALIEASDGQIGTPLDQLYLTCLQYDPEVRGYVATASGVMKASGALVLAALGLFLVLLWRDEKYTPNGERHV